MITGSGGLLDNSLRNGEMVCRHYFLYTVFLYLNFQISIDQLISNPFLISVKNIAVSHRRGAKDAFPDEQTLEEGNRCLQILVGKR